MNHKDITIKVGDREVSLKSMSNDALQLLLSVIEGEIKARQELERILPNQEAVVFVNVSGKDLDLGEGVIMKKGYSTEVSVEGIFI